MQSRAQKRDLTQGPIIPHVIRLALPMTIGIGSIISFSIADTYFIGQLGGKELAAIGFTMPITTLYFNLIFGMAIAMSAVVSRKIGSKLIDDVKQTVVIGLAMSALLGCGLATLGYLLMDPIFSSMGAGDEMLPIIRSYMTIWFMGAVFLSLPIVANSAMRGMGDAYGPAAVMVLVAIINIILDPILIFGLLGAPRMGVQGAAVASVVAYFISTIAALSLLIFRERAIQLRYLLSSSAWRLASKSLLVIAIPVSLSSAIVPLLAYGYTSFLAMISHEAVAGFGVVSRFEAFALIPVMALAGGMSPLIGQNYGAGRQDRIHEAVTKAIKFGVLYGIGAGIFLMAMARPIAVVFSDVPAIQLFITDYLFFVPLSLVGLNVFVIITSMMNAVEHAKIGLTLNLVKSFLIALPLAYFGIKYMGETGFIGAIIVTNFTGAAMAMCYIRSIRCKQA